jgi:hypothetical protein
LSRRFTYILRGEAAAERLAGLLPQWARGHEAALCAGIAALVFLSRFYRLMYHHWGGVPEWHGWFDQSQYLKAAHAFAAFNFAPDQHHYPPLYALLAAPFVRLSPNDPFFLVNAACVAASVFMLVELFGRIVGRAAAGAFALAFLALPAMLTHIFIIPWNSTLATVLFLMALTSVMALEKNARPRVRNAAMLGASIGLLVLTRPLDAAVALVIVPFWLLAVWRALAGRHLRSRLRATTGYGVMVGVGVALGAALLACSNLLIYGSPGSPYLVGSARLFALSSLPEKIVSLVSDSATLYGEPGQMLFARFPWLTLAIGAALLCLIYGPLWLKAAVVMSALHFGVYSSYLDLLPNGLFRYNNYHYFRWALWLSFLMMPAAAVLAWKRFGSRAWLPGIAVLGLAALLACVQLAAAEIGLAVRQEGERLLVDLSPGRSVQYVDIVGLTGNWQKTYFSDPNATIDGRLLQMVLDIRALPIPGGTRLLFTWPLVGARLEVPLQGWSVASDALAARAGTVQITLGIPAMLRSAFASNH